MNREQVLCDVCPKFCKLREGQIGFCRARSNIGGKIVPINYGQATSLALDPIEKKPLMRFCPGTYILSYGSYGCTLRCPYCQNASISMAGPDNCPHRLITPEGLTAFGKGKRVICVSGYDLYHSLNHRIPLPDLLDAKTRHAAETGEPYAEFDRLYALKDKQFGTLK